jgi:hypothetical protein
LPIAQIKAKNPFVQGPPQRFTDGWFDKAALLLQKDQVQTNSGLSRFRAGSATLKDLLAIGLLWLAGLLIINPVGNFPLNDDWSFGLAVKRLLESGDFRPTAWTSMPLLTQTLWGTLFCLPVGFSFHALRLSTLVMSIVGIVGCYFLVRQMAQSRLLACAAALTLAFNPIYCVLSNTFMTDVHFVALEVWAVLFLARTLRTGSDVDLVIGLALAVAATLSRQLGLCLPIAFALCLLLSRGLSGRWLIRAGIPLVTCAGLLFLFTKWLSLTGRLPQYYYEQTKRLIAALSDPDRLVMSPFSFGRNILLYLGWFSLPVAILTFPTWDRDPSRRRRFVIAGCAGLAFALASLVSLLVSKGRMPLSGNVLLEEGMGPLGLHDTAILWLPNLPSLGTWFWLTVTALGILGGALLVTALVAVSPTLQHVPGLPRLTNEQAASCFPLLCAAAYLLPLLWGFMDRYLIPVLPLLWAGIALPRVDFTAGRFRARIMTAALSLAFLALFAVLGTKDYFAWNRTRWQTLKNLLSTRKLNPEEVDGGFEFNAWHLYRTPFQPEPGKSWWWVRGDTYLLAFGELPDRKVVEEHQFNHCFPPYTGKIFVLLKEPSHTNDAERPVTSHVPAPADATRAR